MRLFFRKTLELFGWKLMGEFPDVKKSVVIIAPHTSNWDFAIGRFYLNAIGISNNTLMKKELFIFPLNIILKGLGAIPIDRHNKKTSVIAQAVSMFNNRENLNLFIAPEGTRKRKTNWKKGFYYIAKEANVKILVLTHLSARYGDPNELLLEARRIFPATFIASDFDIIEIPYIGRIIKKLHGITA